MNFRELRDQDLDSMVNIVQRCRDILGLKAELSWTRESLNDAMKTGKVLGAFKNSQLIAFVLFMELGGVLAESVEVWCLATDPESQGRGIMGVLLGEVQKTVNEIWLEVHERNMRALEFYKNKGFQQVGLRKRYYDDGADALLLSWSSKKP